MKIEDAIKQKKPFKSEFKRSLVNFIYTYNHVMDEIRKEIEPYGLTIQQYNVLRIVKGAGKPMSTSCIRERLVDKMADTSRMVERLCKKGLISKDVCCSDKRKVDIVLSEEGMELIDAMQECDDCLEGIMKNLSLDEARQLSDLLDKIRG